MHELRKGRLLGIEDHHLLYLYQVRNQIIVSIHDLCQFFAMLSFQKKLFFEMAVGYMDDRWKQVLRNKQLLHTAYLHLFTQLLHTQPYLLEKFNLNRMANRVHHASKYAIKSLLAAYFGEIYIFIHEVKIKLDFQHVVVNLCQKSIIVEFFVLLKDCTNSG